jgi:hypothetical protein
LTHIKADSFRRGHQSLGSTGSQQQPKLGCQPLGFILDNFQCR